MYYLKNLFKNVDKRLYILPIVFGLISVIMMLSTSYNDGIVISRAFIIQSTAYILGIVAVFIIMQTNYSALDSWTKHLYIFSILFLLTPLIPGLGVERFGAKIWINIGVTTFQPSEIVKLTFIFIMASYFKKHYENLNSWTSFIKAGLFASPIILIVLRDDFGSAAIFAGIFISMCIFAGLSKRVLGQFTLLSIISMPFLFGRLEKYQKDRILGFIYPEDLTIPSNYQVWHSKIAIGSGGLLGKGLFHGTQKGLEFLPVRNSDFIFAVICEELGFVGGAILIYLLGLFLYSIAKLTFSIKEIYGSLILVGILAMFAFQIFENIAMTMGFMPVTGITLPFISYGGSSVLSNMVAVGIVLSIAQSNRGVAFIKL